MRSTLFALILLATAACSKKAADKADTGPSCDQVTDRVLEIMKSGLTGHGNVEMGNKKQMVEQCEARNMSATQRKCMVAAKDVTALAACSAPPPSAPTAPAGPIATPPAPTP